MTPRGKPGAGAEEGLDSCVSRLDWQTLPGHLALSPDFENLGRLEF